MNLVHVIIGLEPSGAELFLLRLCKEQLKRYDKVTVISLTTKGSLADAFKSAGVNIVALGMNSGLDMFRACWLLRQELLRIKPDLVQSWMYHADLLTALVKLTMPHSPLIWSIRCTDVPAGNKFTYVVMKCCAYLSSFVPDRITCVAAAAKVKHISYGYDPRKLMAIPNGYNFENLQFSAYDRDVIRNKLGLSSELVLGAVGRYHNDKGQDILIEALARYKMAAWKLILVGRYCDSNNQELVARIEQAGLADRIILAGEQSNVSAWLSAFDIFVMPSRTEGFPNALAEAMAVGLCCIATKVGDAALLAEDTVILSKANVNSFSEAIATVFRMKNVERQDLGMLASRRVHAEYSMQKAAANYHQLYSELIK